MTGPTATLVFRLHSDKSGRDMAHLRLVPKRDLTRHELEQQLDALAREYGVSKDKKVFEQMLKNLKGVKSALAIDAK